MRTPFKGKLKANLMFNSDKGRQYFSVSFSIQYFTGGARSTRQEERKRGTRSRGGKVETKLSLFTLGINNRVYQDY